MASSLEEDGNTSMAVINYSDKKQFTGVGDGDYFSLQFQLAVCVCGDVKAGISNVYASHPQSRAERGERV